MQTSVPHVACPRLPRRPREAGRLLLLYSWVIAVHFPQVDRYRMHAVCSRGQRSTDGPRCFLFSSFGKLGANETCSQMATPCMCL